MGRQRLLLGVPTTLPRDATALVVAKANLRHRANQADLSLPSAL
jgi:hypothetical protein